MRRSVLVLILALAACGQAHVTGSPGSTASESSHPVAATSLTASQLAVAQRAFGLDLLGRLCAKDPSGTIALSPASAALALGQLDAGARGASVAAMAKLLHLPEWSPAVVAAFQAQRTALAGLTQVQTSNHLYATPSLAPLPSTLSDLATAFGSRLQRLDFTQPSAARTINAQVSKDTHGLIPTLFDRLDPDTQAVLTNAIHLDARWLRPFLPATSAPFTTASGQTVQVPMMSGHDLAAEHRVSGGWESVQLPYQGGKLSAFALLPPTRSTCGAGTPALLAALTTGEVKDRADVRMPTLKLSQKHDLLKDLQAMGLPGGGYEGFGEGLSVSQVVQKVVVDVDEVGTKAAAATGTVMTSSAIVGAAAVVTFDRPYLLLLQDTDTGTPLFLLRVGNPLAA